MEQIAQGVSKDFASLASIYTPRLTDFSDEVARTQKVHFEKVLRTLNRYHYDAIKRLSVAVHEGVGRPETRDTTLIEEATAERSLVVLARSEVGTLITEILKNPELRFGIEPREFEKVCAELLSRMGFEVELTQATRDGGKDILARKQDPTGEILVRGECKIYKNTVEPTEVRALLGAVVDSRFHRGVLMTTSQFGPDGIDLARRQSERITLWDGSDLLRLFRDYR